MRRHCPIQRGGFLPNRLLQRSIFSRGFASRSGSRMILAAITACIAKLRASSNRCVEYGALTTGARGSHVTTALNPAALRRARRRRIRSAGVNAVPVAGRPRLDRFSSAGFMIYRNA